MNIVRKDLMVLPEVSCRRIEAGGTWAGDDIDLRHFVGVVEYIKAEVGTESIGFILDPYTTLSKITRGSICAPKDIEIAVGGLLGDQALAPGIEYVFIRKIAADPGQSGAPPFELGIADQRQILVHLKSRRQLSYRQE